MRTRCFTIAFSFFEVEWVVSWVLKETFMEYTLQEARQTAFDARIQQESEPDWRRVRWSVERYLDAGLLIREYVALRKTEEIDCAELRAKVDKVEATLGMAYDCIAGFLRDCLPNATEPTCLTNFGNGLEQLRSFLKQGDLENLDTADICFKDTEHKLAELLEELEALEPEQGGD